ncbi:MAG TPA: hypothetical protein VH044_20290 [Polyangiaceae bacterium]|nr:hypothetical protein [Polyangiaceae bacterium]
MREGPGGPDAPVFDAFAWCDSDWLEWRRPAAESASWDHTTPLDGSDPRRMVFVLRGPCVFLPSELARLHAFGLGLTDEEALAPWAIDVATDELYAHRVRPRDVLWLAADNLNALFWGLHDWAHFHNHGPFEQRAWTELQCDTSALAWLWINRGAIGLADDVWERLRGEVVALSRQRFVDEGAGFEDGMLEAGRVRGLAGSIRGMLTPAEGRQLSAEFTEERRREAGREE